MTDHPTPIFDPRAAAMAELARDSEAQNLYAATTPTDCTSDQLARAAEELRKPATFADLLERNRLLAQAVRDYTSAKWSHLRQDIIDAARDRLNAEAERIGLKW